MYKVIKCSNIHEKTYQLLIFLNFACRIMAVVRVYMIRQNNFYPNWTSELYTSDTVARTLPKMFYKGEVLKNFLNTSKFDNTNTRLVEELCIVDVRLMSVSDENPTTWPESTIGIAVITVCAFLLLLFLICWICVCCLRKAENKEE